MRDGNGSFHGRKSMLGFGGLGLGLVAGVATTVGLGYAIDQVSKKADKHLTEMQTLLDNRSRELIRAVPGERYLQLIDDLYGENKEAKERAQTFLTKLAGINPHTSLEASARFGFAEKPPLHAQLFGASVASVEVVRLALDKHEIPNPVAVRSTMAPVPSAEDNRKALIAAVATGLRIVPGGVSCPYTHREPCDRLEQEAFQNSTNKAATNIADAALLAFHQGNEPTVLPADSLTISWNPLIHEYLYLVVLEKDLQAHMADKCAFSNQTLLPTQGCIQFWVHETGDQNKPAYKGGLINVGLNDFMQNPAVELSGYGSVRWVAHRMNPSQLFDLKALQARRSLDALRKELGDDASAAKK